MLGSEEILRIVRLTKQSKSLNKGELPPLMREAIDIEPFRIEQLNSNSYNLRMAPILLVFRGPLDIARDDEPDEIVEVGEEGYQLQPNVLYLGSTVEWTQTLGFVPSLNGRSGTGRKGLSIHVTAGFGDQAFTGDWTTELTAVVPLTVRPYFQIGQISYTPLIGNAKKYAGNYQNQRGPKRSGLWKEADEALRQFRESLKDKKEDWRD